MAIIENEDIRGYNIGGKINCVECWQGKVEDLKEDEIITMQDLESDRLYFCDECKEQI